jgi:hypothetical protein
MRPLLSTMAISAINFRCNLRPPQTEPAPLGQGIIIEWSYTLRFYGSLGYFRYFRPPYADPHVRWCAREKAYRANWSALKKWFESMDIGTRLILGIGKPTGNA